jgi:hypothetical protein
MESKTLLPTAVQLVAAGQDTADSASTRIDVWGLPGTWSAQAVPFHRSAVVTVCPLLLS